jgi:tripartite-type tricarboxylate transporter receptor subunit TctC
LCGHETAWAGTEQKAMRKLTATILAVFAICAWSSCALAAYPEKPIVLIVPYAPGGLGTVFGNLLSEAISPGLGQRVVVDYRPGANGAIGASLVAKAPRDGYTLLMAANGTMTINPQLYPSMGYDPLTSFSPIAMVATSANLLVVNSASPIKSLPNLIDLAKAKPGKVFFGSSGIGSTVHLSGEMLKREASIDVGHVAYKGVGPALVDLMGGQIDFVFSDTSALPYIAAGKLRALGVTSAERFSVTPDLPTLQQLGLKDFVVTSWYAVIAPAGIPKEAVDRLNAEISKALQSPRFRQRLNDAGFQPTSDTSPEYLRNVIRDDFEKWKEFIARAQIKAE